MIACEREVNAVCVFRYRVSRNLRLIQLDRSTAQLAIGAHGSHTTRAKRDISTTHSSSANQNLRKARTRSSCGGRRRPTNDRHLEVAIASAVRLRDSRRSAARHDDASRSPRSRPQSRPPVPAGRATALDAAIGGCRVESEVTWQRAWERSCRLDLHCAKRRCAARPVRSGPRSPRSRSPDPQHLSFVSGRRAYLENLAPD